MEISDSQYERLIGMLADNRAAIITLSNDVKAELGEDRKEWRSGLSSLEKRLDDLKIAASLHGESLSALEQDLGTCQSALRDLNKLTADSNAQHDQALEGLTQLTKTIFDLIHSTHEAQRKASTSNARPSAHGDR